MMSFCNNIYVFSQNINILLANEDKDENMCSYYDTEDCRFAYVYSYDQSGKIIIRAQEERECPPQVYFMGTHYIFIYCCVHC